MTTASRLCSALAPAISSTHSHLQLLDLLRDAVGTVAVVSLRHLNLSAAARAFFAFFLKSAKHFANLAQKTSTSSRVVPNADAAVK